MPHLHLPLQSGSDSVLRRMARRCKTEEFAAIVSQLRKQIPHFNITTDIIVGFPGETEQEWQDSFDFIKQTGFGHIHIFTYSRREGTKAAGLPEQIPEAIKKQRSQQVHELAHEMKLQFNQANLGQTFPVLWEGYSEPLPSNQHRVFGYTPNYLRVASIIEATETVENKTLLTTLITSDENFVLGKLAS
jgi:threonylcarbamoyladenosine tRNA methylthiotransferase MtaB